MAPVSDSDSDPDTSTSTSTPPRRGPAIVSSDSESDSDTPEHPPRHLRAPSRTPSWAKSVSRSPSPIAAPRRRKRSISPVIERWADDGGSEQGYESAESGRIRLLAERSPSVLRDESESESESEVGVSSGDESEAKDSGDESEAEDSGDESGNYGELGAIGERLPSGGRDLQSRDGSEVGESEDDEEASGSGPEDGVETGPEVEGGSEVEAQSEVEADSAAETDSEVEIDPEVEVESEVGAQFEADSEAEAVPEVEINSEVEAESEVEPDSEVEADSEAEADLEAEADPDAESEAEDSPEPLHEPKSEDNSEPEEGLDPNSEAEFADESQLETQPTYEPPPSLHSHANSTINSGPATPSPSDDDSDTEEEEEEEEAAPFVSPNKRPIAPPPDSPSPSDRSEAGDGADWHSDVSESAEPPGAGSGQDEDEDEDEDQEEPIPAPPSRKRRTTTRRGPKITGRKRGMQIDKHNPRYLELLNDQIALAASRGLSELKHDRERVTPVLGSVWTRRERDMFFKYLAIVGRDDVAELARLIGTKSVVECRAYVKALQDGREHDWHAPAKRWAKGRDMVSSRDIPAAVELSDECVEALEEEADALEARTLKDEERREKIKWGDRWRLDAKSSWTIEQLYKKKDIEGIHQIAPEAELLNICNMLEISESIFMNGSGDDHNWQFLGSDPPAIRHTAFKDLHTLVVSLTRRIVQTTIYMATSRLRGMESKVFNQAKLIRPIDVEAAVSCLRLPESSREYWMRIPRRIGLHVYNRKEDIRKKTNEGFIPYDELEQILRCTRAYGSGSGVNSGDNNDEEDDEAVEATMDALLAAAYVERDGNHGGIKDEGALDPMDTEALDLDSETGIDDGENYESIGSDVDVDGTLRSKPQKKTDANLEAIDDAEDVYMEALDKKRSYKEEMALWEMMGKEPSRPLPKVAKQLPELLPLERKRPLELTNWRDSAGYLASWETDKRRKTQHYGSLWGEGKESSAATHSATIFSESQTTTDLHRPKVIPKKKKKPAAKRQKKAKAISPVKAISPPAHRPRRLRERRQSKVYSGFVSTVDNIIESDQEALARELEEDDGSFSEESAH